MKILLGISGLILVAVIGFILWSPSYNQAIENEVTIESSEMSEEQTETEVNNKKVSVTEGSYIVDIERSSIRWAGQKPFVDGYVNSGSLSVANGNISVSEGLATGEFTIDMNTLSVSNTPAKPGKESLLEEHLKGENWFAVDTYPTATFSIKTVSPREDSDSSFTYDITGDLTMKGTTDELTFPAMIYVNGEGELEAKADLEFDRTIWGITSGSGSFFDGLADNVIDDMVALSFELVANKTE